MKGLNQVILIGTMGRDPELTTIQRRDGSTTSKASFSMVTNKSYKQDNEWKEDATWHTIEVWGQPADFAAKYLKKGYDVTVVGEIRYDSWEDKDGAKKDRTVIVARELIPHDNRSKGTSNQQQQPVQQQQPQNVTENVQQYVGQSSGNEQVVYSNENFPEEEDDLPF